MNIPILTLSPDGRGVMNNSIQTFHGAEYLHDAISGSAVSDEKQFVDDYSGKGYASIARYFPGSNSGFSVTKSGPISFPFQQHLYGENRHGFSADSRIIVAASDSSGSDSLTIHDCCAITGWNELLGVAVVGDPTASSPLYGVIRGVIEDTPKRARQGNNASTRRTGSGTKFFIVQISGVVKVALSAETAALTSLEAMWMKISDRHAWTDAQKVANGSGTYIFLGHFLGSTVSDIEAERDAGGEANAVAYVMLNDTKDLGFLPAELGPSTDGSLLFYDEDTESWQATETAPADRSVPYWNPTGGTGGDGAWEFTADVAGSDTTFLRHKADGTVDWHEFTATGLPTGVTSQVLYYDGDSWEMSAGSITEGHVLTMTSGVPTWAAAAGGGGGGHTQLHNIYSATDHDGTGNANTIPFVDNDSDVNPSPTFPALTDSNPEMLCSMGSDTVANAPEWKNLPDLLEALTDYDGSSASAFWPQVLRVNNVAGTLTLIWDDLIDDDSITNDEVLRVVKTGAGTALDPTIATIQGTDIDYNDLVYVSSPNTNDILYYDGGWLRGTLGDGIEITGGVLQADVGTGSAEVAAGDHVHALNDLSDVDLTGFADGHYLMFDSSAPNKWVSTAVAPGSGAGISGTAPVASQFAVWEDPTTLAGSGFFDALMADTSTDSASSDYTSGTGYPRIIHRDYVAGDEAWEEGPMFPNTMYDKQMVYVTKDGNKTHEFHPVIAASPSGGQMNFYNGDTDTWDTVDPVNTQAGVMIWDHDAESGEGAWKALQAADNATESYKVLQLDPTTRIPVWDYLRAH